jgi:hypothetical protein
MLNQWNACSHVCVFGSLMDGSLFPVPGGSPILVRECDGWRVGKQASKPGSFNVRLTFETTRSKASQEGAGQAGSQQGAGKAHIRLGGRTLALSIVLRHG